MLELLGRLKRRNRNLLIEGRIFFKSNIGEMESRVRRILDFGEKIRNYA
jgi:hypothetical protein